MTLLLPAAVLIFCLPVIYLPAAKISLVMWITAIAFIVGTLGCSWPFLMPTHFLIDHPWATDTPLHPSLAMFCGGMSLLFAVGLTLALASRSILIYMKFLKAR